MRKARWITVVLLVAGVLAIGAFGNQEGPIKIGVAMNLTGPWASIDTPAKDGVLLAIDEINAAGGLLGRQVEPIVIDTKADEAEAVMAMTRFAGAGASAILGYCDTHWVLVSAPIATEYGIPYLTPGATHPRIPERTGAWLACFGDNVQAAAMAERAYKERDLSKVAVWIDSACDYSVAVCRYFEDAIEHYGGTVVYKDYFETDWTDFSGLATRLKAEEDKGTIDSVYIGAIPDNCGLIAKQIRDAGVTIPILGEDGMDTPLLVDVGGKDAEGVEFTTHISLDSPEPAVVNFVTAYEAEYGVKPPNAFAALGYDAMKLVAEAIQIMGSAEPKMVSAGLSLIRDERAYHGATGTISYLPGEKVPAKSVAILRVEGGKFIAVETIVPEYIPPAELAK